MTRRKKIILNLEITDIVPEGKGLGRDNEMVVFVKDVVPGDVVDVLVQKNKSAFKEGIAIKFHKYSDLRQKAECEHFNLCGGCKWQNIEYQEQLFFKNKLVTDAFDRIAKVPVKISNKILGAENIFFYRNKLEYTFSSHRWLTEKEMGNEKPTKANGIGFHLPGMFDRIVDITKCHLQSDLSNEIKNLIRDFSIENEYDFYDIRTRNGFLRNLIIRNSYDSGEYMVIMVFGYEDVEKRVALLELIKNNFSQVVSLYYFINEKVNDIYNDLEQKLYFGKDSIVEKIGDLQFKIGPKSFFQTNTFQAKKLYDLTIQFADLQGDEVVYDLYTGTGTIAQYLSQKAKKVVGIETIKEAIEDAKLNAELNNITNCDFFVGNVEDILKVDFIKQNGKPNVIVLDPPRAGLHPDVVKVLNISKPKKIVYVSCNPATQARDVNMLSENYDVEMIQPVDMFPHTFHVENIALLKLK